MLLNESIMINELPSPIECFDCMHPSLRTVNLFDCSFYFSFIFFLTLVVHCNLFLHIAFIWIACIIYLFIFHSWLFLLILICLPVNVKGRKQFLSGVHAAVFFSCLVVFSPLTFLLVFLLCMKIDWLVKDFPVYSFQTAKYCWIFFSLVEKAQSLSRSVSTWYTLHIFWSPLHESGQVEGGKFEFCFF